MAQFAIRFNKTAGQPGRGTSDHVWRVFDRQKEYIAKQVRINVPSWGEKTGEDWSICCDGELTIDREMSTVTINARVS
jgi:hypothetical protein